jgi:hypothetical protein
MSSVGPIIENGVAPARMRACSALAQTPDSRVVRGCEYLWDVAEGV